MTALIIIGSILLAWFGPGYIAAKAMIDYNGGGRNNYRYALDRVWSKFWGGPFGYLWMLTGRPGQRRSMRKVHRIPDNLGEFVGYKLFRIKS